MNQFVARLKSGVFNITAEFTPKNPDDVIEIAHKLGAANSKYCKKGIVFSGVMITQNPAGRMSYDTLLTVKAVKESKPPEDIEIIPHITCKDQNAVGIEQQLRALIDLDVRTILALTGDKPTKAKAVFQIDSLGLIQLTGKINADIAKKAKNLKEFKEAPQIAAGAAISPYKYTEGSLAMQYFKAEKKIFCGAEFLISQVGWDSEKSKELIKAKKNLRVPIMGNTLFLDYKTAIIMKELPGCVVSDEFFEKLKTESFEDGLNRVAQQIAMFQALGYDGVDIGNLENYDHIIEVVDKSLEIKDWKEHKKNISFVPPPPKCVALSGPSTVLNYLHNQSFEKEGSLYDITKSAMTLAENSYQKNKGLIYKSLFGFEHLVKGAAFECKVCGDCYLPENYFVCTEGGCAKGLPNPPCGDATKEGICGNDEKRPCAAELIYFRAKQKNDINKLRRRVIPPRKIELDGTSSFLNHYFGRSHSMQPNLEARSGLKQIAELIHATIPSVGPAMQFIKEMGVEGFTTSNKGLNVILDLIKTQAETQPAFIDVNIDQLKDDTPWIMRNYVKLVKTHGMGVPISIDSSNPEVLKEGLISWYEDGGEVKPPLLNSINYAELEKYMPVLEMRKKYSFEIIGLLSGPTGILKSTEEMFGAAKDFFKKASALGFKPEQLYFDTVTLGVTFDSPFNELGEIKPSHTFNSFNAIKKIRTDEEMKGVNCVLGVSNWVHGVKNRRIGHIRSFVAVAMKYGLNAAIVDVFKEFGIKPTSPELDEIVEMFATLDGGEETMLTYSAMIQDYRAKQWV